MATVRHQVTTVGDPLDTLKVELERFGEANDAVTNERPRRMLNISRDTGEFLAVLARGTATRRVLEIGTSMPSARRIPAGGRTFVAFFAQEAC